MRDKITTIIILATLFTGHAFGWTTPIPVSELNTSQDEISPFISYDRQSIYFSRDEGGGYQDIYHATRTGTTGPFSGVTKALDGSDIIYPWVSNDELRMYYAAEGPTWKLKFTERASINDPWTLGSDISELNSYSDTITGPELSGDELTILFVAYNMTGGQGGYDIWMSTRPDVDSLFGEPVNLTAINTSAFDAGASLSTNGLELYFSSDRNGTKQVFKSTRNSIYDSFGAPVHLSELDFPGSSLNGPCISSDGTTLYCSSGGDIYVSYVPEPATILLFGLGGLALRRGHKK